MFTLNIEYNKMGKWNVCKVIFNYTVRYAQYVQKQWYMNSSIYMCVQVQECGMYSYVVLSDDL